MNWYSLVFRSSTAAWRGLLSIGNTLAYWLSEPFLHQAGLSMPRTVAASQTRPSLPNMALWLLARVSQRTLIAPIGRRRRRLDRAGMARSKRDRHSRIGHRHLEERHRVGLRIEDRAVVGRIFRRAVQQAVGVDRRIAPIRRDQVVHVLVGRRPVPGGDDEVALDAGRPRRLVLRQLALGDAVGPVAEILVRHAAELAGDAVGHHLAGLAGGDAAHPGVLAGLELAELRRDGAGRLLAELMAADAVDVVHLLAPAVARDVLRNVGRAAEVLLRRNLHHHVPVDRRIIVRGRGRVRRGHRRQIERAGRAWRASSASRRGHSRAPRPGSSRSADRG